MRMALDLGLSAGALNKNISDRGRHLLATTWASVMQLNSFASTCTFADIPLASVRTLIMFYVAGV